MTSPATRPLSVFASNLRALRRASGLTQSDVAAHLGVESMTVSRWERAQRMPRDHHLVGLAGLLSGGDLSAFYREQAATEAAA